MKKKMIILICGGLGVLLLVGGLILNYFQGAYTFSKVEKEFTELVKTYYENNPLYLPKGENIPKTITLSELVSMGRTEGFTIGNNRNTCDVNSWVRVVRENNEYRYITYLKCGKYESKTDNTPPVITLKGESSMYLQLGNSYVEEGILSVTDNKSKLEISDVIIDASKLKESKTGKYDISYSVYDEAYNEAVVKREVNIVVGLKDVVARDTKNTNVYRGTSANNYVYFSGMVWRIVKVNLDGSIKIVTEDSIANIPYGGDEAGFNSSNIDTWLNEYFYKNLNNPEKFIKTDATWCLDKVVDYNLASVDCTTYSEGKPVGLLRLGEFKDSFDGGYSYLSSRSTYWFLDNYDVDYGWQYYFYTENKVKTELQNKLVGVRPVVNLKAEEVFVVSGDGSSEKPYKLNDYSYGREHDLLNTRLVGEYISYGGQYWQISGFDSEGNIKVIMANTLKDGENRNAVFVEYEDYDNALKKYDPLVEGNLGFQVNEELSAYVNDKLLIEHEFSYPLLDQDLKYNELELDTYNAKFGLPVSYEMFAGASDNQMLLNEPYWLSDYTDVEGYAYMVNSANGIAFRVNIGEYGMNGVRMVSYITKDAKIASGQGTLSNPYYIK